MRSPPATSESDPAMYSIAVRAVRTRGSRRIVSEFEIASIPVYVPAPFEKALRRMMAAAAIARGGAFATALGMEDAAGGPKMTIEMRTTWVGRKRMKIGMRTGTDSFTPRKFI